MQRSTELLRPRTGCTSGGVNKTREGCRNPRTGRPRIYRTIVCRTHRPAVYGSACNRQRERGPAARGRARRADRGRLPRGVRLDRGLVSLPASQRRPDRCLRAGERRDLPGGPGGVGGGSPGIFLAAARKRCASGNGRSQPGPERHPHGRDRRCLGERFRGDLH